MTTESQELENQLQQFKGRLLLMKFIHLALVMGVVLFGLVVFLITRGKMTFELTLKDPMFIVGLCVSAGSMVAASRLRVLVFKAGAKPTDIAAAVNRYQVFVLIRAAIIEGASLFCAVMTLMTHNVLPAGLYILCGVVLAAYFPSQQEFVGLMREDKETAWK